MVHSKYLDITKYIRYDSRATNRQLPLHNVPFTAIAVFYGNWTIFFNNLLSTYGKIYCGRKIYGNLSYDNSVDN